MKKRGGKIGGEVMSGRFGRKKRGIRLVGEGNRCIHTLDTKGLKILYFNTQ